MSRTPTLVAWLCASVAGLLLVAPFVGVHLGNAATVGLLVAGIALVVAMNRERRAHPTHVVIACVLGVSVLVDLRRTSPGGLGDQLDGVINVAVAIALVGAAAFLLHRRRGGLTISDGMDATIVLTGGALATWISIVDPALDRGDHTTFAVLLAAAHLPLGVLLFGTLAVFLPSGLTRNRSAWLLFAAVTVHLAGTVVRTFDRIGALSYGRNPWWLAAAMSAFLLAVAAAVHPSVAQSRRTSADSVRTRVVVRLAIVLASLMLPLVMIAAVPSGSSADRLVRVIGTVLIALVASIRLIGAIAASDTAERRLVDHSRYDELTRLPNRVQLLDEITAHFDDTWRTHHRPAVLQLNIDRFKNINDSLGHDLANTILIEIAGRLREVADGFDGIVARTSGDEFVVLVPDATETDAAERAELVRASFGEPIQADDRKVFITASVGYAIAPKNRIISAGEFLRRADVAMHRAKSGGRNQVARFDDSMLETVSQRLEIESALPGALERREFYLDHQPIIDVSTGAVSGFEALIRWRRANGEIVRPDQFIGVAEETGLINEIGAWALVEGLTQLRHWINAGIVPPTATMSINVSPRQIADARLPEIVHDAILRAGVPARLLWVEVTESMMLSEPDLARATLQEIGAMGVRIALDDFGTGYSSLSLLQGFPLHRLKIDRAFVSRLGENENDQDRSLVRTIIAMGESLGLDIVAEGVETVDQLLVLRELGCAKAQGYLISRPVPADAMPSTMTALRDLGDLAMFSGAAAAPAAVDAPHATVA